MYKQCYLYARVSSRKQDTLSQLPSLQRWKDANDPLAELLVDVGTGKNMKRESIQTITRGIECGMTRRVVVVSINRVGRNVTQVSSFIDLCVSRKVSLVSLREGFDSSTPMGAMMAKLLACVAELENEQRSQATIAGIEAYRAKCKKNGLPCSFGGSRAGHPNKMTKSKAEWIKKLHDEGKSYRQIAKEVGLCDKSVRSEVLHPRTTYLKN